MLERAVGANIPGEILLTDSAYGDSNEFRQGVRAPRLDIAVGIRSTTKVRRIGARERLGKPMTVGDSAKSVVQVQVKLQVNVNELPSQNFGQ